MCREGLELEPPRFCGCYWNGHRCWQYYDCLSKRDLVGLGSKRSRHQGKLKNQDIPFTHSCTKRYMNRCSMSLIQVKTTWRYLLTPVRWLSSKGIEITNIGKYLEKKKFWCTVGRNVNWHRYYGKQHGISPKS